jgi:ornithine cyclodeaminase/alanine dehydrogenase-like protein (mu-crystallin family)
MKRALFWGTLVAGAVAAYMMYRRGESLGVIGHRIENSFQLRIVHRSFYSWGKLI